MTDELSDYRHPKHDTIVEMLRQGHTDTAIAAELHVDRRASARVRRIIGLKPMTNTTTLTHKFEKFSVTMPDGHTGWTGRRNKSSGAPVIRQQDRQVPAAAVAFEIRTGRAAVGITKSECGVDHCLTPGHVSDDDERRRLRLQERAVAGLAAPWDVCSRGHSWDAEGRVNPDLSLYCRACQTERTVRHREAKKAEEQS